MAFSSLTALSPLDGRYVSKLAALRPLLSEYGLMHRRVQVEVEWFIALSEAGFAEFPVLPESAKGLLRSLVVRFSEADAQAIKDIEKETNHDVKAVEYWLRQRIGHVPELADKLEFIHFACTSEDINNTSHALMLKAAREQVVLPAVDGILTRMQAMAHRFAAVPMLSRTHGQTASPTTVGKEVANVLARLTHARARIAEVVLLAKMNGAVGNYNAHVSAYPEADWEEFSRRVAEERLGLKLNPYTIQIEPHDYMAELFDATVRLNTILIDWARDVWGYVSLGYFKQRTKPGEVGSSTMPHKVNPIDFENAEGNLGMANALLEHFSAKLPISRLQRDLTDSTVLRNLGVPVAHTFISIRSIEKGLGKLLLNENKLNEDLENNWAVVAEAIQTILRRENYPNPYEALKALTRGNATINKKSIHKFIDGLDVEASIKKELKAITPHNYTGV